MAVSSEYVLNIVRAEEKGHTFMRKTARAFHSIVGAQRKSKDRA